MLPFHLHAVEQLGLLPSIASFFFRHSRQRYGPPQGAYGEEQWLPPFSSIKPSNGSWSTWQIAQREGGEAAFKDRFLPNLQEQSLVLNGLGVSKLISNSGLSFHFSTKNTTLIRSRQLT